MNFSKHHTAFTLIELMISVSIIAILTAIVVTNLADSKAKSRDGKRVADIAQLQLALELFFDRCNRYPVTDGNTTAPMPVLSDNGNGCPSGVSLNTFISKLPTPPTANDYKYTVNDNGSPVTPTDYILSAKLEKPNQALNDDIDTTSSTVIYPSSPGALPCTDTSPNYYYCVSPR